MKSTGHKLILVSFILALIGSGIVLWYLQSLKAPSQAVKKATFYVAADTIPARTLIDKKMIKEITVMDTSIFTDYLKNSSDIVGKYTKETIMKNEGFHKDKLLDKSSNELSIKLENGYRAVSISATGASGVSDLLQPGDFVDIVVYLAERKDGQTITRPDIAGTILQNIEVLAVDKDLDRDEKKMAATDKEKNMTSFLVTLSVKSADVEKIFLSENIGSLKLALRPIKDNQTIETNGTVWQNLIIDPGSAPPQPSSTGASNSKSKYTRYTVKHGDTLKKISRDFYGDESKYTVIKEANNIKNENMIITGEVIKIPTL